MYQNCHRRLLPSMASTTLLSPATTSKPCLLRCDSSSREALHRHSALALRSHSTQFPASRSSSDKSGNCFIAGFALSSSDCTHRRSRTCCCLCCRRNSARVAFSCVKVYARSASKAASLLLIGESYIQMRKLSRVAGFCASGSGINRNQPRVRALSTSLVVSSKKKSKTKSSEVPVIDQPSLTWGIVPHSSEGKEIVIEFLEREGIDTSELHDVELPNTIEVMQERLDFLKNLGLSLDSINSYPLMVTCSIKKNLVPVLDYLEQLGLRSRDLPKFLEKYPMVLHSSVIIDLMPVVDYLLGLDIQRKDVIRVLMRYPDVLGFRLEGTMSTSVAYIVSLGVRMRCIGRMLTEYPEILGMRVANTIKPKVDFLLSYGIPKPVVARLLEVRPYMLGFDLTDTMQPVVDDLLDAGVRKEGIASIITQYPDILGQGIRQHLIRKTKWLMHQVGVEAKDVPVILEKLPQILFIKEGLAMERVRFFRDAGMSAEDVALMVTECPQILALSIGHVIEPSLNFLLHDMKRSVKEVVKFPTYFTYDLKSRIMPRYKLIAEKGIDCSLEWFLNCTEQVFKMRLSAEYLDDEEPGPVFQMGGVVHTETKPVEENLDSSMYEQDGMREQLSFSSHQQRQAAMSHTQQRNRKLDISSNSEIEGFSGGEDELDRYETHSELDEEDDDEDDEIELSLRGYGNANKAVGTGNQRRALNSHSKVSSQQDMYSEDDDTDDAQDILRARLQDDKDLDILESASEFDFSEEGEERNDDDDDEDEEWGISEDEEAQYNASNTRNR